MVFEDHTFKLDTKKLYKESMESLDDYSLNEFMPLTASSFFKEEYKNRNIQEEYILSYLYSAKILADKAKNDHKSYMVTIFSVSIPCIYLCRHSLELTLKFHIKNNSKNKLNHNLLNLWKEFMFQISSEQSEDDKKILASMEEFICSIDKLDHKGTQLRYATEKNGAYTQKSFLWVNPQYIVSETESFIKQLKSLSTK